MINDSKLNNESISTKLKSQKPSTKEVKEQISGKAILS